ncbi:phage tail tube protein [Pseudohongiella spirulinae]|uniref:Uncharacterized protein n=1 Tax=Pseudohongiella spirulinae TaxID=1249552 RepID=A0A0S2KE19_9GAMM|nr:phage tail tube protein [Pseudohongiella spirulinae]ALO46572.1 hypothetical protein PS2015_1926 [Pseudohongiella spirulinae]
MSFLARNQIILVKIEDTYATDPTPTESLNAVLTKNLQRQMYNGNRVSRDVDYPYMANDFSINTAPSVQLTFDVELAGSGDAGTAPQLDALLRACGFASTVVAETSVTYSPVSGAFESCAIYYNYDGEMQKIVGARGTWTLNMARGALPSVSFTITGLYAKPTAVEQYDPTYTAISPLPFSSYNTTTFSVHGQAVRGEGLSIDGGVNVVHRNLAGYDGVNITDRAPTGSVSFEAPTIATKDFFAQMESHNKSPVTGAISVVHGTTAGNIVTITAGQTQITNINEQDSDGIRTFSAEFIPVPTDSGNDEFSIAFT